MSWRPGNWELEADNWELGGRIAFEAGADAMLEALRNKENAKTDFAREVWRRYFAPHEGTVVFIPGEEQG